MKIEMYYIRLKIKSLFTVIDDNCSSISLMTLVVGTSGAVDRLLLSETKIYSKYLTMII